MRRAEWVDLSISDTVGLPMRAHEGWELGESWGAREVVAETLRLMELEDSRLHISITTHTGEVIDYIFHGHYLIKWAKEDGDG